MNAVIFAVLSWKSVLSQSADLLNIKYMSRSFRSMAVAMNAIVQLSWSTIWYLENSSAEKCKCVVSVPSAVN